MAEKPNFYAIIPANVRYDENLTGNAIAIDGSIQTRDYTDKNGNNRTAFEVVADNVSFVERKAQGSEGEAPYSPSGDNFEEADEGGLPF